MTRERFKDILRNHQFNNNANTENEDRGYKVKFLRPLQSFCIGYIQQADHRRVMGKFKGGSVMKQYMKQKPIKWGFKFWLRSESNTDYVYQINLYVGKKVLSNIDLENMLLLNSGKL